MNRRGKRIAFTVAATGLALATTSGDGGFPRMVATELADYFTTAPGGGVKTGMPSESTPANCWFTKSNSTSSGIS